jgi:3-dehydroquinate synthase
MGVWLPPLVHRGLRQVRVPTTVLGQDDAGVGVKNGVNFAAARTLGTLRRHSPSSTTSISSSHDRLPRASPKHSKSRSFGFRLFPGYAKSRSLPARDFVAMQHLVERCAEILDHIADR